MAGQPKPTFYVALFLVVVGLAALGIYRFSNVIFPKGDNKNGDGKPTEDLKPGDLGFGAERADTADPQTPKAPNWVPSERLPEVKGTSDYKLTDNTVRFAINVWAGWGPIILANDGFAAGKVWKTSDGKEYKIELVLIDNPVAMRDSYANGEVQIGWGTLDMLPLFMEGFVDRNGKPRDSRVMPRVFQQIDWSNGGDGIVTRESIKTVADLRGKKLALAQNSPSHYFALNMLVAGGLQPSEVQMQFTEDAFKAADAFAALPEVAGCVSWAPNIYTLSDAPGNHMLVSTQTANKLITDVWFARADFAKDHPGLIEALVRGIFDAMEEMKEEARKNKCADLMAAGYNIPVKDTLSMFGDAHSTNWAENREFFLNQHNPTNFEHVWKQAYLLYGHIRSITHQPVPFDQVMDFSVIEKLGQDSKYANQRDEYQVTYVAKSVEEIQGAEKDPIVTHTVRIHFAPRSYNLEETIERRRNGKMVSELYDPTIDATLEDVAALVGKFGSARVVIEGHTDSSMRDEGGEKIVELVRELSENRANAVKQALVRKYPSIDPNQLSVKGWGWDRPLEPENHAKNRRVEVKVYPAEQE